MKFSNFQKTRKPNLMAVWHNLIIVCGIMMIGMFLPQTQFSADAQISHPMTRITPTTIDSAYFKTGYFKKNAAGGWDEFDANDNIRFSFQEVLRDESSVFLQNGQHNVSIEINDAARAIYASWPGQSRHLMHRMTNATIAPPIAPAPPVVTAPPLTVRPPIAVAPPVAVAPQPNIKPSAVASVAYRGGEIIKFGKNWIETTDAGDRFTYLHLGYDNKNVYLFDGSTNRLIILDVPAKAIRHSKGERVRRRNKVTEFSAVATAPPTPPEEPNFHKKLPESERLLCLASGGKVEQAGMLGHERCTKLYSDANMSCTDSSQCQGRCLDPSQQSEQSNVVGKCQATDNPFGCFTEVKNGATTFGLCVD